MEFQRKRGRGKEARRARTSEETEQNEELDAASKTNGNAHSRCGSAWVWIRGGTITSDTLTDTATRSEINQEYSGLA